MNLSQRVAKIKTLEDAEQQITLAKNYARRLRAKAKRAAMLSDKLAIQEQVKAADSTLRRLRMAIFDIEDAIKAGKPASSVFPGLD